MKCQLIASELMTHLHYAIKHDGKWYRIAKVSPTDDRIIVKLEGDLLLEVVYHPTDMIDVGFIG
jgi:hypothetical protein